MDEHKNEGNISLADAKANVANLLNIAPSELNANPMKKGNEKLLKMAMELEKTASMMQEETNGKIKQQEVYQKFAKQLKNGTGFSQLAQGVVSDLQTDINDTQTRELVKAKVEALHSAITDMKTADFEGAECLALSVDNVDNNITQTKNASKIQALKANVQALVAQLKIKNIKEAKAEISQREEQFKARRDKIKNLMQDTITKSQIIGSGTQGTTQPTADTTSTSTSATSSSTQSTTQPTADTTSTSATSSSTQSTTTGSTSTGNGF